MEKTSTVQIDEAIRPYLNEIAERLWSGHGAVMVGAGFSKNANGIVNSGFPDWSQLGDLFYEKTHGLKPDDKKYLNVLKLADEVQATLGRPALDQLLRSNIPDKASEPSQLHIKLLNLPWTDVFTTNYDTLLERTCSSVTSQKYDVVVNKEDLVYSEKPRIIKLHGSFPSERPFIITEEDYRRYPLEFAPFVNTVQQALLENMLCLIGFSGDDPNFLHWIGWIRDNLGSQNAPKIYMVGIVNLSDAQKKLLEQRNIILVDFTQTPGVEGSHYNALDRFCDYLLSRKEEDNRLEWPMNQKSIHPNMNNQDKIAQLKDIIVEWESARVTYPGWCVLPEDRRDYLWIFTEHWINFINTKDGIPDLLDIQYTYELNWRLEKCLCPIFHGISELISNILQKYNPFPQADSINAALITPVRPEYKELAWDKIKIMWLHLCLSILRYYREEGYFDKWQETNKLLEQLNQYLSPEQKARLHYERTMYALFALDVPDVRKQIKEWPSNESLPFWETKRAGLLAEIGQVEDAEIILEQSLKSIRAKLNLKPITTDYSLVSQESVTLYLFEHVRNYTSFRKRNMEKQEVLLQQLTERRNILKQYKCDPWNELKLFENKLNRLATEKQDVSEKKEFDIGSITLTYHMGGGDEEAISAYAFLRFCEDTGIPFNISNYALCNKSAKGTLSRISKYSSYWALATLIRIGDANIVDNIYNRESINEYDIAFVDTLVDGYLSAIKKSQNDINTGDGLHADTLSLLLFRIIPEILSRLCCKCSFTAKEKVLDFLLDVYKNDRRSNYRGINNLTNRLIESLSNHQQYNIIPKLLEFPVLGNIDPVTEREFLNPFHFLRINKEHILNWEKSKIEEAQIRSLLIQSNSKVQSIRRWAVTSLVQLYQLDLLGTVLSAEFGNTLWAQVDEYGFPANTVYKHRYIFINIAHPKEIDVVSLFKKYVQSTSFLIQKNKGKSGVSITRGNIPVCKDLVHASKYIVWGEDEVIFILMRVVEWWDADKEYLKKDEQGSPFVSISDEFRSRFINLINILEEVILPTLNPKTHKDIKDTVGRILSELEKYGLPSLRAEARSIYVFPERKKEIISKIENALVSNNNELVADGLEAILIVLLNYKNSQNEPEISYLLDLLGQIIKWRRKYGLAQALDAVAILINKRPDLCTHELEDCVLKGLAQLADETNLLSNFFQFDVFEKLLLRRSAASLAYIMYENYSKQGKQVQATIKKWEEICRSEKEFAEIRNQWIKIDE